MASLEITDEGFRELYQNHEVVVLDFWAVWCAPCHQFAPTYEEVSETFPEMVFGKIDTEAQPKLSAYFGIRSIPTIVVIRDQVEVFRHSGILGKDAFENILRQVKSLDMEEVRKKVESEEQQSSE